MKNKGFTLVEVLAVVVLLGLLAGLVIIKVLPSINESKYSVGYASTTNLVDALEDYYFQIKMNGNFTGCSFDFSENNNSCSGFVFSGKKPTGGSLIINSDGNINGTVYFDKNSYQVINNKLITTDTAQVINVGTEYEFDYTGSEQRFIVPVDGIYKLEVWGAQGGNLSDTYSDYYGGYGGYSVGSIYLGKGSVVYINVGGVGTSFCGSSDCSGGYNGGGTGAGNSSYPVYSSAGGGATHVALSSGVLSSLSDSKDSILIVAGGGGGTSYQSGGYTGLGGSGGGKTGVNGSNLNSSYIAGNGGSQTAGGSAGSTNRGQDGSFGKGGNGTLYAGGGGGGYYGGGASNQSGAGGGSGYIGNKNLFDKSMYCYGCTASIGYSIKTVNTESFSESPVSGYAKVGNGYAKITFEHLGYDDSRSHNHVYYSYGTEFELIYTYKTWSSSEAVKDSDSISFCPDDYCIAYTDYIDLSMYNTVIIKKTGFTNKNRGYFAQYPERTNNIGTQLLLDWKELDTDLYVADISSYTRDDTKFALDAWSGENFGKTYYISFSTKTVAEVTADYSFID